MAGTVLSWNTALLEVEWEARFGIVGFFSEGFSLCAFPKPQAFFGAREGLPVAPFCKWKGRRMFKERGRKL